MQATRMGVFAAALLLPNIFALGLLTTQTGGESPIPRVVNLLRKLLETIETEAKTEEDLYEKYMCWGSSTISSKKASNAEAQTRIDSLTQYVADLDAGAIELTSERTDLDKEIQQISEGLEAAANKRAQENKDYEMAKEEMDAAILALTEAIDVLGKMSENKTTGVFLKVKDRLNEGMGMTFAQRSAQGARIDHAIEIADKYLRKGDAIFLRRALTGEVPDVDWKKLNRKATFKMSYKARSFKIQAVLADMLATFNKTLTDAQAKEKSDIASFDALTSTKDSQLQAAQSNYASMAVEKGAKAEARSEASTEKDALTTQISTDKEFISQTQASLATKTAEWKARQELRSAELAAISKAISFLHSDDARNLMKKSFKSQGYLLLQESEKRWSKASALLTRLASATKDRRLLAIAPFSQKEKDAIAPAIQAIDSLIEKLKEDEKDDLQKKEQCESERAADTRDAILRARLIDEKTDAITGLQENIEELAATIDATNKSKIETELELKEAQANRDAEHKEYLANKQDDMDAASLVKSAETTLSGFYKEKGLMLAQGAALTKQPVETVAGEAPTPPPTTWEGAYMGATSESTGIIAILAMVHEDIEKDIAKANADEKASNDAFLDFKQLAETDIAADIATITKLEGTKGSKIADKSTATQERSTAKATLNSLLAAIETKASAGCDYFAVNYKLRLANRQIELDGLTKAKAYLQGGEFSKIDPNREMKPGDAASAALLEDHVHKAKQQRLRR
mmetsp:Transcript_3267/g.5748  ORF Transcript_3267/g.5748 Transcript_3267/m.5748 type:complete len:746 (-) Transcript_3267:69-2306(-)